MVELRGLEPLTPSLRTRCATSCATAPKDRQAIRRDLARNRWLLGEAHPHTRGWPAPTQCHRRAHRLRTRHVRETDAGIARPARTPGGLGPCRCADRHVPQAAQGAASRETPVQSTIRRLTMGCSHRVDPRRPGYGWQHLPAADAHPFGLANPRAPRIAALVGAGRCAPARRQGLRSRRQRTDPRGTPAQASAHIRRTTPPQSRQSQAAGSLPTSSVDVSRSGGTSRQRPRGGPLPRPAGQALDRKQSRATREIQEHATYGPRAVGALNHRDGLRVVHAHHHCAVADHDDLAVLPPLCAGPSDHQTASREHPNSRRLLGPSCPDAAKPIGGDDHAGHPSLAHLIAAHPSVAHPHVGHSAPWPPCDHVGQDASHASACVDRPRHRFPSSTRPGISLPTRISRSISSGKPDRGDAARWG